MMVEVIPILVFEDLSSLMLLPGGFVLAEILGPLLSSSSGAREGEGAGAAVKGRGARCVRVKYFDNEEQPSSLVPARGAEIILRRVQGTTSTSRRVRSNIQ